MRKLLVCSVLVAVGLVPAQASEPGEPQDCTDWVVVEPGLYCTEMVALRDSAWAWLGGGVQPVFDNEGYLYRVRTARGPTPCADCLSTLNRVELYRTDGYTEEVVGYFEDQCIGSPCSLDRVLTSDHLVFDGEGGRMILFLEDRDDDNHGYRWIATIGGFATHFEVLHTYQPSTAEIAFRVPYMPEGFQYADYFDTYYGDLVTVGDWSQAQPLQCGYPATPPAAGDYLTVADTLPTPGPGHGYYYVTAVTYQGATRYGRKCVNGVLSGRDPAVLPGCGE